MRHLSAVLAIGLLLIWIACGEPPRVVQGSVTDYNPDSNTLIMTEENQAGAVFVVSLAEAEMGAPPVAGDRVRISYVTRGDRAVALRVMHLSSAEEHVEAE